MLDAYSLSEYCRFLVQQSSVNTFKIFENGFNAHLRSKWRESFINRCLVQLSDCERLVGFMFRYVTFNSIFAGCIARLAGKLHGSQHLFRDKGEPELHLADRSAEVASRIFFAAEDEYDVQHLGKRVTHRGLAQFLLRELLRICSSPSGIITLNDRELDEMNKNLMTGVGEAYEAEAGPEDESLFYAMGFHLASERFADQEFNLVDKFLQRDFPQVVKGLREKKGPAGLDAYYWISAHCVVETEHADAAHDAMQLAFNYYVGNCGRGKIAEAALRGVADFARIQETLFEQAADAARS